MVDNLPLTKVEIIWAEIIEVSDRLNKLTESILAAENNVGNTVTSIEESLLALQFKMQEIGQSANGVLSEKQEELNKQIELALNEAASKTAQRDLEVVELISESVETRLKEMYESISADLSKSVEKNAAHIQTEASKHLVKATKAISLSKSIDKGISISLTIVFMTIFGAACVYGGWHLAYLEYAKSSREADKFITSSTGKSSLEFARLNDVNAMLECKGFKTTKQSGHTYCLPMDKKNNVSGWRIN